MSTIMRRVIAGAGLAIATTTAVAFAAPDALAATKLPVGNYTCAWSINVKKDITPAHRGDLNVPVKCSGVMTSIDITATAYNPGDHVNWSLPEHCSGTSACNLGTYTGEFDYQVVACIRVQIRLAVASDCKSVLAP